MEQKPANKQNVTRGQEETFLDQNIRFLRRSLGWSQEELGTRIGLNRGNIASYENGTAEPKIGNLFKLADLFGVSIMDITQRNLSGEAENAATEAIIDCDGSPNHWAYYRQHAQEIQSVMRGLHTCCHFKVRHSNHDTSKDMQVVAMHFEELFNAAQALLREHLELLEQLENVKKM